MIKVYEALYKRWGPQYWWPGRTRFEIIMGAILTQNTAWSNVERAIRRLRRERALNPVKINEADTAELAEWIRPAGYFNVKSHRIKAFIKVLFDKFDGDLRKLFLLETIALREVLLNINGIGPETADSIILYAAKRPVFVVDAYTRRVLFRHGWIGKRTDYDDVAAFMTQHIPCDVQLYNEYHALIVRLCKEHCRAKALCEGCPISKWLPK